MSPLANGIVNVQSRKLNYVSLGEVNFFQHLHCFYSSLIGHLLI